MKPDMASCLEMLVFFFFFNKNADAAKKEFPLRLVLHFYPAFQQLIALWNISKSSCSLPKS